MLLRVQVWPPSTDGSRFANPLGELPGFFALDRGGQAAEVGVHSIAGFAASEAAPDAADDQVKLLGPIADIFEAGGEVGTGHEIAQGVSRPE